MTVLLIDAAGNVREWTIPELVPSLRVPLQNTTSWVHSANIVVQRPRFSYVRFDYSDEPSYPPVYRYAGVVDS